MIKWKSESGFNLIEMAVTLGIVGVLAATLTPTTIRFIGNAKLRAAQNDCAIIASAINQFQSDTTLTPVYTRYSNNNKTRGNVDTLRGPGKDPLSDYGWLRGRHVDTLEHQLQTDTPRYATSGENAWKGPYIEDLKKDPWGNSYMVNVRHMHPDEYSNAQSVLVLSAGPNGRVETPFNGNYTQPGGDDIAVRIK